MLNWNVCLSWNEQFRCHSTILNWMGFPYWRQNVWGFSAKWPQNFRRDEKHLLEGHFLTPSFDFCNCACNHLYPFGLCRCVSNKKSGRNITCGLYLTHAWSDPKWTDRNHTLQVFCLIVVDLEVLELWFVKGIHQSTNTLQNVLPILWSIYWKNIKGILSDLKKSDYLVGNNF